MKQLFYSLLLILTLSVSTLGQGVPNIVDVTDPPVATIVANTYDVTNGVVTRASGTHTFATWIANGRLKINGNLYTVNTRDSDTQVTLNDLTLTGVSGATIQFGPDAATPWDGVDDAPYIQACVTYIESAHNLRGVLYFPGGAGDNFVAPAESSDGYRVNTTINIGNGMKGWRIQGTGMGNNVGGQGAANLAWSGAGSGPIFALQDCSGLVMDGISFEGNGEDGSGDPIVKLVTIRNEDDAAASATFNLAIRNCFFSDAPTLLELGCLNEPVGLGGNANYLWSNCVFEGDHNGQDKAQYGIRNLHNQGLMHTFVQCEWRNCNICIQFDEGGRFQVYGGGLGDCYQFIKRIKGSANSAGVAVRDLFINNGGIPRTVLYEGDQAGEGRYWGPITFEGIQTGSSWPAVNFAEVTSFNGNTLILASGGQVDVRPGDEIAFYNVNDLDTRLAITEVESRTDSQNYTLAETAVELDITIDTDTRVAHGTPLFKLTGAERLSVRDCWWTRDAVRGKRLARLQTGQWSTIVQPIASFTMNSGLRVANASQLASIYLDINETAGGTAYYRFTDCDDLQFQSQPYSYSNIPGDQGGGGSFTNAPDHTAATDPTTTDDTTQGFAVGHRWINTSTQHEWVCISATENEAVWKNTTRIPPFGN